MNARTNRKELKTLDESNKELSQAVTPLGQYFNMVAMAMRNGDLNQAQQMIQMKREFEADEARKAYFKAMSKFRGLCPPIIKDARVHYEKKGSGGVTDYRHETLDGIMLTIKDTLSQCGLNPSFGSDVQNGIIMVTCRISHKDGHYEETSLPSPPDSSGGKNSIQAIGSAITYLQRYTLKLMLGLSAGEDTDALNIPEEEKKELISKDQVNKIWVYAAENEIEGNLDRLLKGWSLKKVEDIWSENFDYVMSTLKQAAEAQSK